MTSIPNNVSKAALLAGSLSMAAAGFVLLGVAGAASQVLSPFGGFLLMVLGLGLSLVTLVTSIVGLIATAPAKNCEGRSTALRGLAISVVILGALGTGASKGRGLPRINDITTDVDNPPAFVSAQEAEPNHGRDMAYPGPSFAERQQQAYPDLASLVLAEDPGAAFDRVHAQLARRLHLKIIGENRDEGRIEGTETSALFHFSDDIVVRIRPFQDGGSRVDIRSKSRDGKGDLGVNAARIREILAAVRKNAFEGGGD